MDRRTFLAGAAVFLSGRVGAQVPTPSLSPREAHEAAAAGALLIVDIRTPAEWRDTGVPRGAIRLDAEGAGFEVRLAGLRLDHRGKTITLIDRAGGYAGALAQKLAGRGWREIVAVRGGMLGPEGWLAQKLPVEQP